MAARKLSTVVSEGNRRRSLEAVRDRVAKELETAEGRDVAPLSKALVDVIRELDSLPLGEKGSTVADISARIAAKRAAEASGL